MYAIESSSLTKNYSRGRIKALTDFSISVASGTIYCLLGPNGAGKTTFMKLMLSIASPTSGEAFINGKKISDPSSRSSIGYLSESHRLPGFLNAEQFLYYYGKMSGASGYEIKKRIPELLKKVKLDDKKDLKIRKYSKGMLQRLGTAHALINDPRIIFLDEPTDGIDPVGRIEIREILFELKKEGKTVFINSHLLSEVERLSDRIAILKDGRMIKEGATSEFLESTGNYIISVEKGASDQLRSVLNENGVSYTLREERAVAGINSAGLLNLVIDDLRSRNVSITGIEEQKNSLEDFFIKVIK